MGFFETLARETWNDWTPWLFVALAVTGALIRSHAPADRPRVRTVALLLGAHVLTIVVGAGQAAAGYDPTHWGLAALAFGLIAGVGMVSLSAFRVILPRLGLPVPRILSDLFTAAGFVIALIIVGGRAGFSVAGLITTSAVVTAVIGFSLQDTLGNVMGGLALQLDNSIRVGDWVSLGVGQPNGKVTEIRWRYTAIETRNWETMIVPNSVLMKTPMIVLGKRSLGSTLWRRTVEFYVDHRTPPTDVLATVERVLRTDPPTRCATEPAPICQFGGIRDSYAVYWARYWLSDLTSDDGGDSDVRVRISFALRRAGIPFSIPAQALFITEESVERETRKEEEDVAARARAIARLELFGGLEPALQQRLARDLRLTPFAAGEAVTHEGRDDDRGLFIISRGAAVVRIGAGPAAREVARLEPGQFFGEMSLMTGATRAATVIAVTDLQTFRLDRATFQELLKDHPELADHFAGVLATRQAELAAAQGELEEVRRSRRETTKNDLLGRIRTLFGLGA